MKSKMFKSGFFIGTLILLALLLVGCSASSGPKISIENAWGRASPKVATTGVFYMMIKNEGNEDDRLVAAKSPACGVIELHESYKTDEGAMGMRPVEGGAIEIPAGSQTGLKIGGLHLMCIDKLEEFEAGVILPLTLSFEKSGNIKIDIQIREP